MAILGLAMNHGLSFLPFTKTTAAGTACNTEFTSSSNELYISRNIISINTLPVELFTAIFELCLPNGLSSDPDVPALVHIISVCRHWRAVALMAPHLWARLMLWDPRGRQVKMVGQWLGRSQSCPLTLVIHHSSRYSVSHNEVVETTHQILAILLRHLHRWRSVTLRLQSFPAFPILPLDPAAAPALESVVVCNGKACFDYETAAQFWQTIFGYPVLRRVEWMSGSQLCCLTDTIHSGWEKLTHLRSRFVVDDTLFDVLSRCRSLQVLHIEELDASSSPLVSKGKFIIPSLHSLTITSGTTPINTVLDRLVLPSLWKAELYFSGSGLKEWADLLNRSGCLITDLTLHTEGDTPENDVAALVSAPALKGLHNLVASFSESTNFLVHRFTCTTEPIFPNLRYLSLRLETERCVEGTIAGMVYARTHLPNSTLKRVVINHHPMGSELAQLSIDAQLIKQMRIGGVDAKYYGD